MNNLILRESILKTSLWMYGLVVYTGMNTKIMKNRNSSANIKGVFNSKIDLIFLVCFGVNLFLGLLFSFLYLYRSKDRPFFYMTNYHFQMFSVLLPHALYIFHKIYLICYSFIYKEDGMEIRNFEYLYKLGEIDVAILADHGVINSG
jgi:magnesium-transporting ATPase (P-type)